MYEFLEGRVVECAPARLVLEVAGVGYELSVPLGARWKSGERARVFTHLLVREDAHLLFGFPEQLTRDLFRQLLRVRGVGPSIALGLLSGLSRVDLLEAICAEDLGRLTAQRGVGRKTAEQIVLDLRARATGLLAHERNAAMEDTPPLPSLDAAKSSAVSALTSIGFGEKEARRAVDKAAARVPGDDLEQLVRAALEG
jgi:Holliday junction DNA helicase RuvA